MIADEHIAELACSQAPEERPLHWMYALDPEDSNVDVLPEHFDTQGGCDECKGAFVAIDAFGVEAPPTLATTVVAGESLQIVSEFSMLVSAVRLECSLGHLTVVRPSAWRPVGMLGLVAMAVIAGATMWMRATEQAR